MDRSIKEHPTVNSIDVAKLAGVSQSAVSRVFTKGASVSPRTKQKVLNAAQQLGYQPNRLARSLITGQSHIIGLVVAYLNNQFYPESIQQLSLRLQEQGYHILMFTSDNRPEQVDHIFQSMLSYKVDGIITASISMNNQLSIACKQAGIPIVLFNRLQDSPDLSSVTSDNYRGGQLMANHFANLGVKRPAYIAGFREASTQQMREAGFRDGLHSRGLKHYASDDGHFNYDQAVAATLRLFSTPEQPDALFVANDHMAFAAMDTLRFKLGLRIPEDVWVAGYDDVPLASWPSYDLTTIRQPIESMTEATVQLLLDAIAQPTQPSQKITISTTLIKRGSTQKT